MTEIIRILFEQIIEQKIEPEKMDHERIMEEFANLPQDQFEEADLDAAMQWVQDSMEYDKIIIDSERLNESQGTRIFNSLEYQKLSEKARGFLSSMQQNNMITPSVREFIIDRCMMLNTNYIDFEEVRWALLFVMLNQTARDEVLGGLSENLSTIDISGLTPEMLIEA